MHKVVYNKTTNDTLEALRKQLMKFVVLLDEMEKHKIYTLSKTMK